MSEVWQPIPGYDYRYSVSSTGRVRREEQMSTCGEVTPEKIMKLSFTNGSIFVNLNRNGKATRTGLLKIMAMAFLGLEEDDTHHEVVAIDGDKWNTELSNITLRKRLCYYQDKGFKFVGTVGAQKRYMVTKDGKVFDYKAGKMVMPEEVDGKRKVRISGEINRVPVDDLVLKAFDPPMYKSMMARKKKWYGIYKDKKTGRFYAQPYGVTQKKIYIGIFDTREEARDVVRLYLKHGMIKFKGEDFFCIPDFDGQYFMSRNENVITKDKRYIKQTSLGNGDFSLRMSQAGKVGTFILSELKIKTFGMRLNSALRTSKFNGVSKHGDGWLSTGSSKEKKTVYLGFYKTEEEARDRRLLYDKTGA